MKIWRRVCGWLGLWLAFAMGVPGLGLAIARAEIDWPAIHYRKIATTPGFPTHLTHAGDGSGRLFIVEQAGLIRIFKNGQIATTPFLDIRGKVRSGGEQGLLSVAFPPGYAAKGYFYVNYTRQGDGATVISRFALAGGGHPDVADPASESVIMTIAQPQENHNGGQIAFGPDGYLYIGMGDGGGQGDPTNQSQNGLSLLGKLLRIDVESGVTPYAVPPSNPFLLNSAYRPEIWALGLRNPWRFSFDRLTGDLFIGDVGGDQREEVDFQSASSAGGENYGWRLREGTYDHYTDPSMDISTLTSPVKEFIHAGFSAVIGGFVYRGPSRPKWDGIYIYGDYSQGQLVGLKREGERWTAQLIGKLPGSINTFGEDQAGQIYVAGEDGWLYVLSDDPPATPVSFDPPGGFYNDDVDVRLTSEPGAVINYTIYLQDLTRLYGSVVSGEIVKMTGTSAIAAASSTPGQSDSADAYSNYTLEVSPPTSNLDGISLSPPVRLEISCATPGASIRYTLDGSEPGESSPLYSGPFLLTPPVTLAIRASRPGFNPRNANHRVELLLAEKTVVTTLAGTGLPGFVDGAAGQFTYPFALCLGPHGNLYVADRGNAAVRKVSPTGFVSTLAGGTYGSADGIGTDAQFGTISGICYSPNQQLVVLETLPGAVRAISLAGETITLAAPVYTSYNAKIKADAGGRLYWPGMSNLQSLSGTLVSPASSLFENDFTRISGLGISLSGSIYVSSQDKVWLLDGTGSLLALAGGGSRSAVSDGQSTDARFQNPAGLCVDRFGSIYLADAFRVRKITPQGLVSTLAGSSMPGWRDGPGATAQFSSEISDVCVDFWGNVYVADTGNHRIRKITQLDWHHEVYTIQAGDYRGAVKGNGGLVGLTQLTISANGSFSGLFRFAGGARTLLRGTFTVDSLNNWVFASNLETPLGALQLNLNLDPSMGQIVGRAVGTGQSFELSLQLATGSPTHPHSLAGRFTLLIAPPIDNMGLSFGTGYGSMLVSTSGRIRMAGKLGDGRRWSAATRLGDNGGCALFLQPYPTNQGLLAGQLQFTEYPDSDALGSLTWVKPANGRGIFPGGFQVNSPVVVSRFNPAHGVSLLGLADSSTPVRLELSGGDLALPLARTFSMRADWRGFAALADQGRLSMRWVPQTGIFTGSLVDAASHARRFSGAVLQKQHRAGGTFLHEDKAGAVTLTPAVPQ